MAKYRIYKLKNDNRQIFGHEEFEARSDDLAIQRVEAYWGGEAMELWSDRRRVKKFAPLAVQTASARPLLHSYC
jgi:hypothetical protein